MFFTNSNSLDFLLQKMEPPIRNTFAADRVIFRIGVFTVPSHTQLLKFKPK